VLSNKIDNEQIYWQYVWEQKKMLLESQDYKNQKIKVYYVIKAIINTTVYNYSHFIELWLFRTVS